MPLINKLFVLFLLSALLTVTAGAQTPKKSADSSGEIKAEITAEKDEQLSAQIGSDSLSLQNNEGKCQLLFNEQTINLDLPWQCSFHRLPEGKIRVFPKDFYQAKTKRVPKAYRDTRIILIEYSKPVPTAPNECRTELQAIKIVKKQLSKSTKMENLAACPPFQWDAKNFTALFE